MISLNAIYVNINCLDSLTVPQDEQENLVGTYSER